MNFSSGKMNCVGARSMNDANRAIRNLTRKLREAHVKVKKDPKVKVQNIVASVNFGRKFDLENIARRFENTEYELEGFFRSCVQARRSKRRAVAVRVGQGRLRRDEKHEGCKKSGSKKTSKILLGY